MNRDDELGAAVRAHFNQQRATRTHDDDLERAVVAYLGDYRPETTTPEDDNDPKDAA